MSPRTLPEIFSVSQLTKEIKIFFENNYRFIKIIGEVSNLKTPFSGHSYFTLKDDEAQLQAVLFKQRKRFIAKKLSDGQQVICFGQITVYEPRGNYQLIVDSIEPAGAGTIQLEFERLKKRLAAQGYFDEERKQPIPQYPGKIAVISSATGAAFADFLKIVQLRSAGVHIQLYPVRVQGEQAPEEIAQAIRELDASRNHDVIALIRGGGSLEDLQAFNTEQVADAIFRAQRPIITGIGHQINFTIADFCADYRCPTPTAVAEYLIADNTLLKRQLNNLNNRLYSTMRHQLNTAEQRLRYYRRSLGSIRRQMTDAEHKLQLRHAQMLSAMSDVLIAANKHLERAAHQLQLLSPHGKIFLAHNQLESLKQRIHQALFHTLEKKKRELGGTAALLHSVSPLATLARGYSITRKKTEDGTLAVLRSAHEATPGDTVEILLQQGILLCTVEKSEQKDTTHISSSKPEKK